MTSNYLISIILIVTAVFGLRENDEVKNLRPQFDWSNSLALCHESSTKIEGKCMGKANCTACSDCSRCAHCGNGGYCGVCARPVFRTPKPEPRYTPSPTPKPAPRSTHAPAYKPKEKLLIESPNENIPSVIVPTVKPPIVSTPFFEAPYIVLEPTSLRELPDSQSKVLRRFKAGDEVFLIESPKGPWWKVSYNDRVGWVKKALLKKR